MMFQGLFDTYAAADEINGNVAIQDLTPKFTPTKDLTMYVDVLPPDSAAKMYVVDQTKAGLNARVKAPNVMGVCDEFRSNDISVVSPIGMAVNYFRSFKKGPPMLYENKLGGLSRRSDAVIEISKAPSHGTLKLWREDLPEVYHYLSNKGYEGLDSFEFVVSLDGQALKIIYSVEVFPEDADQNHVGYCKWPFSTWKISLAPETDTGTTNLPAWQTQSQLSALLAGNIASATQGFTSTANSKYQLDESGTSATEFSIEIVTGYATNPMMLVAQKNANNKPLNMVLDSCMRAEKGEATILPLFHIKSYLSSIKKSHVGYIPDAKVTVLRQPEFGAIESYKLPSSGETIFMYKAFDKEWLGKDRAEFLVEYQGKTYKVIQRIEMVVDAELSDKPYEKYYSGPCNATTHRIAIHGEVI